jgi:uroporphyrinogen-III synthase
MATASLAGWTVGVTADRRSQEQIELLERRGARVVHGPTIETIALHENPALAAATLDIVAHPPGFAVLTTGVGVRAWFDAADALGIGDTLVEVLRDAVVLARGPKAAGAALTAGLAVAWQAPDARTDQLVDHLGAMGVEGERVAVQLDGRAEPVLADALARIGAQVVPVPVYRWALPDPVDAGRRLLDQVCDGAVDALTFTSAPALLNALDIAHAMGRRDALLAALRGTCALVSIGSVCTDTARAQGIEPAVEPPRPRLGAMVMALARHASAVTAGLAHRVGTTPVVLRASAVVVGDRVVELAPRERAVCAALLERPGVVVSKTELRQRAWGDAHVEPHAVEAVVARLRRRVDGSLSITAVPRRGYRLDAG